MVENPPISIIIPVYNVEKYLKECLDSVINQTYTNLEIILVDDGSTDSSGEICDKFAKQDSRIKVIHQKNAGQAAARNKALDIMKGEYLAFIDSDDMVDENYIEILFEMIQKYNTKISMVNLYRFENINEIVNLKKQNFDNKCFVLSSKEVFRKVFKFGNKDKIHFWPQVIPFLYHKDIFKTLRFREGILFEDTDIYYEIIEQENPNKNLAVCYKKLYFYRKNPNSTMNTFNEKKLARNEVVAKFVEKILATHGDLYKESRIFKSSLAIKLFLEIIKQDDYKKYSYTIQECQKIVKENLDFISLSKLEFSRALKLKFFTISKCLYILMYRLVKL